MAGKKPDSNVEVIEKKMTQTMPESEKKNPPKIPLSDLTMINKICGKSNND